MGIVVVPVPFRNHACRLIGAMGYGEPNNGGPIVAGGAVRRILLGQNDVEADIDVFFPADRPCWIAADTLRNTRNEIWIKTPVTKKTLPISPIGKFEVEEETSQSFAPFVSKNKTLDLGIKFEGVERKVQFIDTSLMAMTLEKLFKTFDFTCCCLATDGHHIWGTEEAFADNERMILRLNEGRKETAAVRTAQRYLKYTKDYGYQPVRGLVEEMVRIALEAADDNMKGAVSYV